MLSETRQPHFFHWTYQAAPLEEFPDSWDTALLNVYRADLADSSSNDDAAASSTFSSSDNRGGDDRRGVCGANRCAVT